MMPRLPTRLLLLVVFCIAPFQSAFSESQKDPLEAKLKSAVQEAQARLPALQVWQKTLFEDEILPQYQRFIRDYKNSSSGLKVEVDVDSLKHYLAFYGPQSLKQRNPSILLLLKTDNNCEKCTENSALIRKIIQSRVENRGFSAQFIPPTEISKTGGSMSESLIALMKKRNAPAALWVEWTLAPDEDLDTAHPDEKRYVTHSFLQVKDSFLQAQQKDLLDTDSFEGIEIKLMTELFTELGRQFQPIQAASLEADRDEVLVEVNGVRDYPHYLKLKNDLENLLKDVSTSIEDRSFSKGQITFSVFTKKKSEEIKKYISQLGQIAPATDSDPRIRLGVQ